jgi:hypothetical protein
MALGMESLESTMRDVDDKCERRPTPLASNESYCLCLRGHEQVVHGAAQRPRRKIATANSGKQLAGTGCCDTVRSEGLVRRRRRGERPLRAD